MVYLLSEIAIALVIAGPRRVCNRLAGTRHPRTIAGQPGRINQSLPVFAMLDRIRRAIGEAMARYLTQTINCYSSFSSHESPRLHEFLLPGDVLLVEGDSRVSGVIKYLTQSTWSHAAFYAGDATGRFTESGEPCPLIEAELGQGVIASPLSRYHKLNTRICRPVGLREEDRAQLIDRMVSALGLDYDLKHIVDLARYLFPAPPVPARFRRRMIALGSGDPTRAICSTLIAQSFQAIRYPILPRIEAMEPSSDRQLIAREILHIRHHSLFTPRDFDVSPFFAVIKPTVQRGFDYRQLELLRDEADAMNLDASRGSPG